MSIRTKAASDRLLQDHADGKTPKRLQTKVSDLADMRLRERLAELGTSESQYLRGLLYAALFPKE